MPLLVARAGRQLFDAVSSYCGSRLGGPLDMTELALMDDKAMRLLSRAIPTHGSDLRATCASPQKIICVSRKSVMSPAGYAVAPHGHAPAVQAESRLMPSRTTCGRLQSGQVSTLHCASEIACLTRCATSSSAFCLTEGRSTGHPSRAVPRSHRSIRRIPVERRRP
jgi:hypothetical protein